MDTREKGKPRLKRTIVLASSFVLFLLIALAVLIYLFVNSPSFTDLVEKTLSSRLEKHVEMGSITIAWGPEITITDLVISETGKKEKPLAVLPRAEVGLSPLGLIKGEIDRVALRGPKLFLSLEEKKGAGPPEAPAPPALPFSIRKTSIEGAEIGVRLEKGVTIKIGPVNLAIVEGPDRKANIKGEAFIPAFDSTVTFQTGLDMARLDLEQGHADIGSIELDTLSTGNLSLLRGRKLKGSTNLSVDVKRTEKGGLRVDLKCAFKDLSVTGFEVLPGDSHGKLNAVFTVPMDFSSVGVKAGVSLNTPSLGKDGLLEGRLKGAYDVASDKLTLEDASLTSPLLGSFSSGGSFNGLRADALTFTADLVGENVPLANLKKYVLEPLGMGPEGFELKGLWAGTASFSGSLAEALTWRTDFEASNLSIRSESFNVNLWDKALGLVSRGAYNTEDDRVELETLEANLPGFKPMTIRGSLTGVSSADPGINLTVEATELPLAEIKGFISGPAFAWLDAVHISGRGGRGGAEFTIGGTPGSPVLKGNIHARGEGLEIKEAVIKAFEAGTTVKYGEDGVTLVETELKADSVELEVSKEGAFKLSLDNPELEIPRLNYRVRGGAGGESVQGGQFDAADLGFKARNAVAYSDGEEYLKEANLTISGGLVGDFEKNLIKLKAVTLETGSIKGLSMDAALDLNAPVTLEGAADYRAFELEKLWPAVSPDTFKALSPRGKGWMGTSFRVTLPEGGDGGEGGYGSDYRITGTADLKLTGGGFSSQDSTMIGEGIAAEITGSFDLDWPLKKARFTVDARAADFELLLGRFYGDFKDRGLSLSTQGEYSKDTDSVEVTQADIKLADIVSVGVSGKVSGLTAKPLFDFDVDVKELSNRGAYELFIRETYQESFPFLARLEMDGTSSVALSVKGSLESFNARGEVRVTDTNVIARGAKGAKGAKGTKGGEDEKETGLSITGINLTLPVDLEYPEASPGPPGPPGPPATPAPPPPSPPPSSAPGGPEEFGSFTIKRAAWGGVEVTGLELFPAIRRNGLILKEDFTLPVFGGTVSLKNFLFKDVLNPQRGMELSMAVDGVDMTELSAALGLPPFGGSLTGIVPKVSLVGTSLITDGRIRLVVFDGEMRVSEISVTDVFSPVAALKATLEFKDIDLGKLTGTFEFGRISGILEGHVKDLVMVNGQPESFEARVETVKRRGVGQKISVEALENISILGTGSSARILSSGIYQFFKEYNYTKMGFSGRLKNDNFLLLGVETVDSKGYLVKGTLLPPNVNVITYTQNVSFKEMVKRLKRVRTVSSAGGGEGGEAGGGGEGGGGVRIE